MYYDAIAFEIENVTGWNLMQVLAAEMMESTETSVVIESTRGPADEDIKDNPEEVSTDVSTASTKTETTSSTDVSAKSQEREIPSTEVSATAEETWMPITDVSTTLREPDRISIEVSSASGKHEMSPAVVPVTSPDVSNGAIEKAPAIVSTAVSTSSDEPQTRSTFVPTTAYEIGIPPSDASSTPLHKLEEVSTSVPATIYETELPFMDISTTSDEPEMPSTFLTTTTHEAELPPSDASSTTSQKLEEVSTPNPATIYETELPFMDVSTTSTEPETPSTFVSTTVYEAGLSVSDASSTSSEETRMPITTSKEPDTISIQVSITPGKHGTSPIVVTATLPDVSTRVVQTKPSTVQTKQYETVVRPPVFPTGSTKPSPTTAFKTEPVIEATRSELLTERPSEVGAQEGDKCRTGTHDCSSNGKCIPLDESYDCECNQGFEGDGRICADISECGNGFNDCHANATCHNVPGSYYCQCKEGFVGNGKHCEGTNFIIPHTTSAL